MRLNTFIDLLDRGFDVEFNIGDIFYSFTTSEINGKKIYLIGNEKHSVTEKFESIKLMLLFQIDGLPLKDIVENTPEEDIDY